MDSGWVGGCVGMEVAGWLAGWMGGWRGVCGMEMDGGMDSGCGDG